MIFLVMSNRLYKSRIRNYHKERDNSDAIALETAVRSFKGIILHNFSRSVNRTRVIENLQGLINFLVEVYLS